MFLARLILKRLSPHWHGPALAVRDHREQLIYVIGEGVPNLTLIIHQPAFWRRLITHGLSLAFGDAYASGDLEIRGDLQKLLRGFYSSPRKLAGLLSPLRRWQWANNKLKSEQNATFHYDLADDFYRLWLDETMTYSCAYYLQDGDDLVLAQRQKNDLVCRKADFQPDQEILDIGCGWGGLMNWAIREHHVGQTVGVTPSLNQATYINRHLPIPYSRDRLYAFVGSWHDLSHWLPCQFDRIVTVGALEHVGLRQYPHFFQICRHLIKCNGRVLIHCIGRMSRRSPDPWISRRIFPGGYLPSYDELCRAATAAGFIIYDFENLRPHYIQTLTQWLENFRREKPAICEQYGDQLFRRYRLYLESSLAGFRYGGLHLFQFILGTPETAWRLDERRHHLPTFAVPATA